MALGSPLARADVPCVPKGSDPTPPIWLQIRGGLKRPLGRLCGMAALAMQGARAGRGVDVGGPLWPWVAPWALGKSLNRTEPP